MTELPQNLDAERAVLACVLAGHHMEPLQAPVLPMLATWLTAEMFYSAPLGAIWATLVRLHGRGEPVSASSVLNELRGRGQLDAVGGPAALADLFGNEHLPSAAEYFARQIERAYVQRQLISAAGAIARMAYAGAQDTAELIGSAQKQIAQVQLRAAASGLRFLSDLTEREYERLERSSEGAQLGQGLRTGFRDLDEITLGFQDQDLIILAARPSVGKTALAINLAHGMAAAGDRDVLIFSLEMSRDQLMQRMESMHSRIDSMRIRTLRMNDEEASAYLETLAHLAELPIAIDETPAASLAYVRAEAYRVQAERGRKLAIVVDYLQLMSVAGENVDNRVQAVSEISRGLKALAKELDCPVIALSQLSRGVEARQSKVPMLSDLRESGSIEQDADIVMFIYREELYDKETDKRGIAELHIAKHRNGPVGVVPMRFDAATTCFGDLTYRDAEGY